MPAKASPEPSPDRNPDRDHVYDTVLVSHAAIRQDRATQAPRRRKGAAAADCLAVGHAWTARAQRDGWVICIACDVVRAED